MTNVTVSIVLFKNDREKLRVAIDSFLNIKHGPVKLFLIDNSPSNELKDIWNDNNIEYFHNPSNPGFGAAHNIAIEKAMKLGSEFHFIVNPDIHFFDDVITPMVDYMVKNKNVGMMMPQVLNEDHTVQSLPKLLPRPTDIFWRKLKIPKKAYNEFINNYELRFVPKGMIYNAPVLSGCFTLLNLNAISKIGMYDDRYFMYFEDWDLSRRMHQKFKTIYFPQVSVYHGYESGANKSIKLFKIFLKSAFHYFNKWGWFFDRERNQFNKEALAQFK